MAEAKRRGRPPGDADRTKRYALGIRTTKDLKDRIQAVADAAGRSVAQEIELRLERSLAEGAISEELRQLLARIEHAASGAAGAAAAASPAGYRRQILHR
jgi:antitoxin component of RelBE/YafQ-DinJ toxin-antitoxin module